MTPEISSPAVEDYLKAIYQLAEQGGPVSTSAIAERLGIAAGSVTGMLKRLADHGLVEHVPYHGTSLTAAGHETAVRMVRRHRIIESFLVEVLGYTWDRVHAEAENLEHAASDQLIDRMAQVLGEPAADPHGSPIPSSHGDFTVDPLPTLDQLAIGDTATLRRVRDQNPEALRFLAELNLIPGVRIHVLDIQPFNGPLTLQVDGESRIIGRDLARFVHVEPDPP
ncbi:MAG: metal-dependent transcriptional regulator [Gemmatimonadetes bacterium]|nr:metal-dependent transcriptional regulator [Gemmatimonadota bacterium]